VQTTACPSFTCSYLRLSHAIALFLAPYYSPVKRIGAVRKTRHPRTRQQALCRAAVGWFPHCVSLFRSLRLAPHHVCTHSSYCTRRFKGFEVSQRTTVRTIFNMTTNALRPILLECKRDWWATRTHQPSASLPPLVRTRHGNEHSRR